MGELVCPVGTGIKDCKSATLVLKLLLKTPMKLIKHCLLGLLAVTSMCHGAQWFVAPDATPTGNGSKSRPWQLQVALTNTGVAAGDKVWARGGTYSNLFASTISGTSGAPVVVRNFNRERAVIDGQLSIGDSSNIWFWGLEFTDSNKTNRSNPFATIDGGASGTKFINCLIHDCCIGINSTGNRPSTCEAYGNVLWYCGKSSLEHGMYWQNDGPTVKLIQNNLIGYSSGFGIQFYGSAGKANNAHIIQNAIWGSGALWDGKSDIIMGSAGAPGNDQLISGNSLYNPGGRSLDLGYGQHDTNVVVIGNTLMADYPMWLRNESTSYTVTNNLMGSFYGPTIWAYFTNFVFGPHVWDYNTYYNTYASFLGAWSNSFWRVDSPSTNYLFMDWKAINSFDNHSTFSHTPPSASQIYVWPNAYEAKRAHVVVWNFGFSNMVPVDLRGVLSVGDTYQIRNAMDFFAAPVASGTFTNDLIILPLTNLTTATPINTRPIVYPGAANFTTNFAAFVVIGGSTSMDAPSPPTDLRVVSPP
jgi:hypothetical protein